MPDTLGSVAEDHGSPPCLAAFIQNAIHASSCKHTTAGGLQGRASQASMSQHPIHVVFQSQC